MWVEGSFKENENEKDKYTFNQNGPIKFLSDIMKKEGFNNLTQIRIQEL